MAGFQCPYCSQIMSISPETHTIRCTSFESASGSFLTSSGERFQPSAIFVEFYKCPNCGEYTITLSGRGSRVNTISQACIKPNSLAKCFPEYVPLAIRQDYEEACSIVNLSPKASATLSRRCLQSMIRDFWKISGKKRLIDEIDALKDKVPAAQWKVIDSLRHIGNIGAHPEADVNLIIDINPEDAMRLIAVIELLLKQWYVERHEQEKLYADILALNQTTKSQRTKE